MEKNKKKIFREKIKNGRKKKSLKSEDISEELKDINNKSQFPSIKELKIENVPINNVKIPANPLSKNNSSLTNKERIFELTVESEINNKIPQEIDFALKPKRNDSLLNLNEKSTTNGRDYGWKKDPITQEWRRSSIVINPGTNMHKTIESIMSQKDPLDNPVPEEHLPFDIYCKEGAKFILTKKKGLYYWDVNIMGKRISLKLSTSRRSLSISETDAIKRNLFFSPKNFVCFYPKKETQVYLDSFSCINSLSNKKIRIKNYLIHIGTGNYAPRIGLIGSPDQLCIYSLFRFKTDFCSIWMDEGYIFFGDAAIPLPCYDKIKMEPIDTKKKSKFYIILPCHSFLCSDKILENNKYPIFVDLEMPYIALPNSLFWKVMNIFSVEHHLFIENLEEPWDRIRKKKKNLPIFKIELMCETGKKIVLSIPPEVYLLRNQNNGDKYQLLFRPCRDSDWICIGPSVLHHRKITFSCTNRLFWIQ